MSGIPFMRADREKPLWATERRQLPSGEWRITIYLDTKDDEISSRIHKEVANLVKTLMPNREDNL